MFAQYTVGKILAALGGLASFSLALYLFVDFYAPEPTVPQHLRKRFEYLTLIPVLAGLLAYGIESGFITSLAKNFAPCIGSLLGFIVLPWLYSWSKKLPRPLTAGLVILVVIAGLAIWNPTFFKRYWFPILMIFAYLVGLYLAWQRSHNDPPPNQYFSQGGQYAMSYRGLHDALGTQQTVRYDFRHRVPHSHRDKHCRPVARVGSGFWFGAFGVAILISELIMLFQL